jgi:type IV pilus assembly protein PilC
MVQTFRKKLLVSLVYPALLVSVVTVMLIFLITYVVPKFADLFNNLGAELPAITVFMLSLGLNAQKYGWIVAAGGDRRWFCCWRWKQSDRGAERIDRFLLSLPLIGEIRLKYQVANFSRILGTLLQGGLPLVPAMETAGESLSSRQMLNGVTAASERVKEGQSAGEQPGNTEIVSRSGGGNAGGRRIDRALCRRCSRRWRSFTKKTCRRR